jgi:hypothetical protein
MTRVMLLPSAVTKEIRALLPTWLACMIVLVAAGMLGDPRLDALGLLVCGLGSVALGALSIGHEYTHRTLSLLLTQPARRQRLLLIKVAVLAPMLLMIAALAWGAVLNPLQDVVRGRRVWPGDWSATTVIVLPVLCALFVAPLLTMLCRSPLAGMVFALVVPGLMGLVGELLAIARYGLEPANAQVADNFRLAVFWWGMAGVCVAAAIANWLLFLRLEAIEGRDPELQLPRSWTDRSATSAATAVARRHPVWLLMKKELRLQQMAFVVGGIYLLGWATFSSLRHFIPGLGPPLGAIAILYGGLLAVLIGSLASAEERHFGTGEWQLLLPMAAWQQWAVKVVTALILAVALGVGLPAVVAYVHPSADEFRVNTWSAGVVLALTAGSLYVSSLCASGVKALLLSIPGTGLVIGLLVFLSWMIDRSFAVFREAQSVVPTRPAAELSMWVSLGLALGFLAVLLWFGMINHRSGERGASRIWRQAIWMGGYLIMSVSVVSIVLAFY